MPSVPKIIEDLQTRSDKIGETTRTISLSVLALVWLFIAGGDNKPVLPASPNSELLLLAGCLVLLSLLADYLQLVAGYLNSKEVLDVAESTQTKEAKYNPTSFLYRARTSLFWLKQVLALSALLALFLAVIGAYACG